MRPFVVCWAVLRFTYADIPPPQLGDRASEEIGCVNSQGRQVGDGDRYTPRGNDPCEQCTCHKGRPDSCSITSCYPPAQCSAPYLRRSGYCCDYACNGTTTDNPNGNDTLSATNLGLRLVASTVTSFLILALLLFMIHRLRKRRLLVMIRRVDGCRRDLDEACIAHHFALEDASAVGYFVGRDGICDEPPPPYTFWKPPETYIPPGEAPPPYDALTAPPSGEPPFPVIVPSCDQVSRITQTTPCGGEEASSSSSSDDGGDAVIQSDAYYEDGVQTLPHGNVTVVHFRGADQSSDQPVASGNVESNIDTVPESSSAAKSSQPPPRTIQPPQHESYRNHTQTDRCSSYCEMASRTLVQDSAKRLSLQAPPNNFSSFPDPTDWNNGEGASESSSSSASPDNSRGAFSPTSSESSCCSGDVDFSREQPPGDHGQCMSALPSRAKGSLDRTLQRLRRFSFPGRKIRKKGSKCRTDTDNGEQACGTPGAIRPVTIMEAANTVTVTSNGNAHVGRTATCVSTRPASLSILAASKQIPGATPVVITVHCQRSRTAGPVAYDRQEVGSVRLSRSNSICSETGERRYREQPETGVIGDACSMSVQPHPISVVDSAIPPQCVARQVAKLEAEGFRPQCAAGINVRRHRKSPSTVSGGRTTYGGCYNGEASAL